METACPKCGVKIRAKEEWIGRKARCPKCGEVFHIHAPESSTIVIPADAICDGCGGRIHAEELSREIAGKRYCSHCLLELNRSRPT